MQYLDSNLRVLKPGALCAARSRAADSPRRAEVLERRAAGGLCLARGRDDAHRRTGHAVTHRRQATRSRRSLMRRRIRLRKPCLVLDPQPHRQHRQVRPGLRVLHGGDPCEVLFRRHRQQAARLGILPQGRQSRMRYRDDDRERVARPPRWRRRLAGSRRTFPAGRSPQRPAPSGLPRPVRLRRRSEPCLEHALAAPLGLFGDLPARARPLRSRAPHRRRAIAPPSARAADRRAGTGRCRCRWHRRRRRWRNP